MSAMLERVSDPGTYHAFQHFITDAPWSAERVWRQLRTVIPERRGVLILDGTSFPKQGRASVAVARQYCGTLGKVANCQVAVTAVLWTGVRAWMVGAALYVPEAWLTPEARQRVRIPATVRFQEKWRLALTLLRQIRAAGFEVTAVLGDAEFGDNATLRRTLHRLHLPYALGVSSNVTVFRGTPTVAVPPRKPGRSRPPTRLQLTDEARPEAVRAIAAALSGARVATRDLAQRHQSSVGLRILPRSASRPPTSGAATDSRPKSGCSSSGISARRRGSKRIWWRCRRPRRCDRWCAWRITAGRSSNSTGN
jgi:SRSO17 transposase